MTINIPLSQIRAALKKVPEEIDEKTTNKQELREEKEDWKGDQNKKQIVYVDGSSLGNGETTAAAGIGVYWGEDDPRYYFIIIFVGIVLYCVVLFEFKQNQKSNQGIFLNHLKESKQINVQS